MSHRNRFLLVAAAALVLSAGGCRSVDEPLSALFGSTCDETDPVSFGCIDIQGTVSGSRGQPLANIDVSPVLSTAAGLTTDFVLTDSEGHYELRLLRTVDDIRPVSFSLKATARTPAGDEIASEILNVTVSVTPLGEKPDAVTVNFTLPVS